MINLIIKLLIAHILGDFVFQTDTSVKHKQKYKWKSKYFYWHGFIHFLLLVVFLGFDFSSWNFWLTIIVITISHLLIDAWKLQFYNEKNAQRLFFIDQFLHLLVISGVVYWWFPYEIDTEILFSTQSLLLMTALLFCTFVSSVIIKICISKWEKELKNEQNAEEGGESLMDAGKYIGIIERLLVFAFVVLNQWSAIGFLVTAKSVFRFGDLSKGKNRKLTEYILIGTLMSFGLAILTGLLFNMAVSYIN